MVRGELITAKNIAALREGDLVRRVNLVRAVRSLVGRHQLRLTGENRCWDVRAPLRPVTFEAEKGTVS